jgi:hypothetical protein
MTHEQHKYCRRGHALYPATVYRYPDGRTECRECRRARSLRWWRKHGVERRRVTRIATKRRKLEVTQRELEERLATDPIVAAANAYINAVLGNVPQTDVLIETMRAISL